MDANRLLAGHNWLPTSQKAPCARTTAALCIRLVIFLYDLTGFYLPNNGTHSAAQYPRTSMVCITAPCARIWNPHIWAPKDITRAGEHGTGRIHGFQMRKRPPLRRLAVNKVGRSTPNKRPRTSNDSTDGVMGFHLVRVCKKYHKSPLVVLGACGPTNK